MPDPFTEARHHMVERQLRGRGIRDAQVLSAMREIPREVFLRGALARYPEEAYRDGALPVGEGQTLSQPYIVARMTEALRLGPEDRVLEIGTGTGYQAAVLARLAGQVWTVEVDPGLAQHVPPRLEALGIDNVHVEVGDGSLGWPDEAPYDAIIVTAGAPGIPPSLARQLAPGGRMVIPVGTREEQDLLLVTREEDGAGGEGAAEAGPKLRTEVLLSCRFVPLLGEEAWGPGSSHVP